MDQPQVIIECAGKKVESEVIVAYNENSNFTELVKYMDVVSGKGGPAVLEHTMAVLRSHTICLLRVSEWEGSCPQGFGLPETHNLAAYQNLHVYTH